MKRARLGIMASGQGSNAEAVLRACRDGKIHAEGAAIVSNNPNAGVFNVAKDYGIPAFHIERNQFDNGKRFAERLVETFRMHDAQLILLAGYMRKIPPAFLRQWPDAVLNIHPALLPRHGGKGMYGLKVHQSVIESGDIETGVTVHFVDEQYDRGPILLQSGGIPVNDHDTPEILANRVLKLEHQVYSEAVRLWIEKYFR